MVHAQQEPDPFGRLARRHENKFGRIVTEPDQRLGATQDQYPGALVRPRGSEPLGVVAPGGGPVDGAAGKCQPGQYPVSVLCRTRVHRVPAPGLTSAVRASSCHRYATASAPLSSMPISTFSLGAWMWSEFRPAAMKTSGASRISARSASGPLPPSLVNSAWVPNARSTARLPAWTAGESIGAEHGRTPGLSDATAASIPRGVWAATYSPSPVSTCAGSWSATRRNDTLPCASRGTMVFGPGPVSPPPLPLIWAVGLAQIRSRVVSPASPATAWLCPASASHTFSSNGSRANSSRSFGVRFTTLS